MEYVTVIDTITHNMKTENTLRGLMDAEIKHLRIDPRDPKAKYLAFNAIHNAMIAMLRTFNERQQDAV